jgi:hypothetical protein
MTMIIIIIIIIIIIVLMSYFGPGTVSGKRTQAQVTPLNPIFQPRTPPSKPLVSFLLPQRTSAWTWCRWTSGARTWSRGAEQTLSHPFPEPYTPYLQSDSFFLTPPLPKPLMSADFCLDLVSVDLRSAELEKSSRHRIEGLQAAWRTASDQPSLERALSRPPPTPLTPAASVLRSEG